MTDKKVIHINTRRYWQIKTPKGIIFTGTFMECWDQLVSEFGQMTLSQLDHAGIQIVRVKGA